MSRQQNFLLTKHIKRSHKTLHVADEYARNLFEGRTQPLIAHLPPGCGDGKFAATLVDQPRVVYKSQKNKWKWPMHWGVLKMFLAEFRFLTQVATAIKERFVCVYLSMYTMPHQALLENIFGTTIINVKTAEQCVLEYEKHSKKGAHVVLYSDLRTGCSEKCVRADMQTQLEIWQQLNPAIASLKFRLEYTNGRDDVAVTYPDGDVHLLPYTGPTSTESQLIVRKNAPMKKYSSIAYEEQMAYHNTVARYLRYDIIGELSLEHDGICNCYDCSMFAYIIRDYLWTVKNIDASSDTIVRITKMLSSNIAPGKTMLSQTVANIDRIWAFMFFRSYKLCDDSTCGYCTYGRSIIASNESYE